MSIRSFILALAILCLGRAEAQELNCSVSVIAPQIQSTPKRIWKSMETSVYEFMNNRRWTDDNVAVEERIECGVLITINEQAGNNFSGSIQITSSRPIYRTDYPSPLVNVLDQDVAFNYLENTRIDFSMDRFTNNLASILAYYAYVIIGMDYDTFSPEGGTPYYNLAQQIANTAGTSSGAGGWQAFEGTKNRYWFVDNILHTTFKPFRQCLYSYHREGLDIMYEKLEEGRTTIFQSLEKLKSVHQMKPASYNVQLFFNAKSDEVVSLFSKAPQQQKTKLFNTLQIIDPGHISKYQNMVRN